MKKVLSVLLVLFLFLSFVPAAAVQAGVPGPENPWLSEFIDGNDININIDDFGGISVTKFPGSNRLAVAYTGWSESLHYHILRFAMQVPKGTGNCGHYNEWNCMDVDCSKNVGYYNSIAAVPVVAFGKLIGIRFGISYYDLENSRLLYASALYRHFGGTMGDWTVITVQNSPGVGGTAGQFSKLVFDPVTRNPVIAYRTKDREGVSNPQLFLRTATYLGPNKGGNCGPDQTWSCDTIDEATIGDPPNQDTTSFTSIDMGWIDGVLHYFYNKVGSGLKYAFYKPWKPGDPFTLPCSVHDYYCVTLDQNVTKLTQLSVASWSGNLPGTPGYNSQERNNGVYLIYRDGTVKTIRYAYMPKTGTGNCYNDEFNCGVLLTHGVAHRPYVGISVAMDPNYYPAVTYTESSEDYWGDNIVLARPAPAYGVTVGNCGSIYPNNYSWMCINAFEANDNSGAGQIAAIAISSGNLVSIVHNVSYQDINYGLEISRQDDYKTSLPLIRK